MAPVDPANLFIVTTDWHVVSTNAEAGIVGQSWPDDAAGLAAHLAALGHSGVIDLGDVKDHYGAGTGDEIDNYVSRVREVIPYATVNAGATATRPILPGNHDEIADYSTAAATDFSLFDARFWEPPYHWTCDWNAPQIRFIAAHTTIIHSPDALAGFFAIDAAEIAWIADAIDGLPQAWKAIVCTHAPIDPAIGNNVHASRGGMDLRAALSARSSKLVACVNGHRHLDLRLTTLDGIPHLACPGVAYTHTDQRGGFVHLIYSPGAGTITAEQHVATATGYEAAHVPTITVSR